MNYAIDGRPVKADEALAEAASLLQGGKVAVVGSSQLSLEEFFLLTKIRESLGAEVPSYWVSHYAEGDGKLLSADRTPNLRGGLLSGFSNTLPSEDLSELGSKIDAGEITTVLCVGEKICAAGISPEQLKKASVVYFGEQHCDTSQFAKVEIPLLTVFEKSGTFVNQQFRVQSFTQASPGPSSVLFGLSNFTKLHHLLDPNSPYAPSPAAIWQHMSAEVPEFEGLSYNGIPASGVLVKADRFADLPFVEGASLHFEPASEAVEA
jgi:NADH-quinone oxidoreductase subunit G